MTSVERVGIPFAFNCERCWKAVICPACGQHIPDRIRGTYQRHWAAWHPAWESFNVEGTLYILNSKGASLPYIKEGDCPRKGE